MGYELFDIVTISISGILLMLNIKKVKQSSLYIIYLMFFGIYIFPLFLDYIIGFPTYLYFYDATYNSYDRYMGFILSYQDVSTRILYDLFIIGTQIILLYFRGNNYKYRTTINKEKSSLDSLSIPVFLILMSLAILPTLICLFVGYSYIPFVYGWRENPMLSAISQGNYYSFVERLSYVGLASSMICVMLPKVNLPIKALMLILCYTNLCIESKRSLLFFAIALYILLTSRTFGIKLNVKKTAILLVLGIFFVVYQSIVIKMMRGYSDEGILYTQVRIDLFRDDTARLIIYNFLFGNHPLLDYPFQSYFTQFAFLFPIDIINGLWRLGITAIGFNRYLTSALLGISIESGEAWMTTSMIDEIIANFSFLSLIIVPLLLRKLAKYIDNKSNISQVLLLSVILLSFMYSFNYIAYYFEFVILMNYMIKRQRI